MPNICCYCKIHKCNGNLVSRAVFFSHERADLWECTVTSQAQFQRVGARILHTPEPDIGPVLHSVPFPSHEPLPLPPPDPDLWDLSAPDIQDSTLPGVDLDLGIDLPDLTPKVLNPSGLLAAVDYFSNYNAASVTSARPLTSHDAYSLPDNPEQCFLNHQINRTMEAMQTKQSTSSDHVHTEDNDGSDIEDEDDVALPDPTIDEDTPDPFFVQAEDPDDHNIADIPAHLITVYALVSWLHLQFHLPRAACNVLLGVFALILAVFAPSMATPFVTLQSSNRVLGVDKPIHTLAVCPSCQEVYPPSGSPFAQELCTNCKVDLFLEDKTQCGNIRTNKTPVVKYPYLPLSEQIKSMLRIPGMESLLDGWREKPRVLGEYQDIFDGLVCHEKLKGPDGKLFFSNKPDECKGPNGELRIGVNLGVDWWVIINPQYCFLLTCSRFSYIRSNIAPSHSLCPLSFSICNLPPEYR